MVWGLKLCHYRPLIALQCIESRYVYFMYIVFRLFTTCMDDLNSFFSTPSKVGSLGVFGENQRRENIDCSYFNICLCGVTVNVKWSRTLKLFA